MTEEEKLKILEEILSTEEGKKKLADVIHRGIANAFRNGIPITIRKGVMGNILESMSSEDGKHE